MTKAFEARVRKELTVDTEKYRYLYVAEPDRAYIKRLPLDCLGTTAALTEWEIIKEYYPA